MEPFMSMAATTSPGELLLRYPELSAVCIAAAKSTVIILLVILVSWFFRRRSAVARCWILRLAFPALLLAALWPLAAHRLPVAFVKFDVPSAPNMSLPAAPVVMVPESVPVGADSPNDEEPLARGEVAVGEDHPSPEPSAPTLVTAVVHEVKPVSPWERAMPWMRVWVPLGWVCGGLLLVAWMVLRNASGLWWLHHRGHVVAGELIHLGADLADTLGVRRPVLRMVPGLASPLLTGWLRPRLWLPEGVLEMPEGRVKAILHHELAHYQRRDLWWQSVASLACAVWWWNPLVWSLRKRLCHEAELAADEAVVSGNQSAADYAEVLVRVAAAWTGGDTTRMRRAGVPMIGNSAIERRVRAILSENQFRNRMGWSAVISAVAIAFIGLVIASLTAIARQPHEIAGEKESFLKPGQEALVQRLIGILEKRVERTKFVHFETSSVWTRRMEDGSTFTNASIPSKAEAWLEMDANRYRIDYRPRVTPWIDGTAPFFVENSSGLCDGKDAYVLDKYAGDEPRAMPATESPEILSLKYERAALRLLQRPGAFASSDVMRVALEEKEVDGRRVIELTEEFRDSPNGQINQRQTYQLDADDPSVFVLHRLEFPAGPEPHTRSEWRLLESARNEAGDVFPRRFQQKFEDGQTEVSTTRFEILEGLPTGILDLPEREAEKYVSADGAVVNNDKILFRLVDAADGTRVSGAKVRYQINRGRETEAMSDFQGTFSIALPAEEVTALQVAVDQPGYARHRVRFNKEGNPLKLPESLEIKLQPASPIAGQVVGEDGAPVYDAKVVAWLSDGSLHGAAFWAGVATGNVTATTDAQGRWRMDGFPPDLERFVIRISHPDYMPTTDVDGSGYWMISRQPNTALRDGTSKVTLKSGIRFEGTVVDWKGIPVAKGRVTAGKDNFNNKKPLTRTDEKGTFVLKALKEGATLITVEAPGCRPYQTSIDLPLAQPPVIRLEEPAVLRGRVIREDGTPCVDLDVAVTEWNKTRTLKFRTRTDADGRFVWNGAPLDEVLLTFGWGQNRKDEFLSEYSITATAEEHTIVMKPGMRVRSSVVDDATGEPLPSFTFTRGYDMGQDTIGWERNRAKTITNGRVEWSTDRFQESCFLIEAEGYEPLQTPIYQPAQQTIAEVWRLKRK